MYTLTDTCINIIFFFKVESPLKTAPIPSRDAGEIPGPGTPPKLHSVVLLSDNNSLVLSRGEAGVEMKILAATGRRTGLERHCLAAFRRPPRGLRPGDAVLGAAGNTYKSSHYAKV